MKGRLSPKTWPQQARFLAALQQAGVLHGKISFCCGHSQHGWCHCDVAQRNCGLLKSLKENLWWCTCRNKAVYCRNVDHVPWKKQDTCIKQRESTQSAEARAKLTTKKRHLQIYSRHFPFNSWNHTKRAPERPSTQTSDTQKCHNCAKTNFEKLSETQVKSLKKWPC